MTSRRTFYTCPVVIVDSQVRREAVSRRTDPFAVGTTLVLLCKAFRADPVTQ